MDNLHSVRRTYSEKGLDEADLGTEPIESFRKWLQTAIDQAPDWFEVNAMTLATSDPDGNVTARLVLLKSLDNGCFTFFSNYDSRKGEQLWSNPRASLVFFWPYLERQVRIEGSVTKTPRAVSESYFHSRPRGSQIGAAISAQSQTIESRRELEVLAKQLEEDLAGAEVPCPANWGGYALAPNRIEFWQGRLDRLHDRIVFTLQPDRSWMRSRLAP